MWDLQLLHELQVWFLSRAIGRNLFSFLCLAGVITSPCQFPSFDFFCIWLVRRPDLSHLLEAFLVILYFIVLALDELVAILAGIKQHVHG